jgi:hypothetical protein
MSVTAIIIHELAPLFGIDCKGDKIGHNVFNSYYGLLFNYSKTLQLWQTTTETRIKT